MRNLANIGRIFYGLAVVDTGLQTIYYRNFPYWLLPPHSWIPNLVVTAYIAGALLVLAGAAILFGKKIRVISLLLGTVLLLVFCFWYVPYELMARSRYLHLLQWENAEKELAFASGAFIIASCYLDKNERSFSRLLGKLIPLASICFPLMMISFGILHFLYAKDVADYVPSWMPNRLFWAYFAGAALIGLALRLF